VVATPAADLRAVAVLSPTNVWALGTTGKGADERSVIAHWDGTRFTLNAAPKGQLLKGVAALAPGNVWVVGSDPKKALIEHWNGRGWRRLSTPKGVESLADIAMESRTSGWAVGRSPATEYGWKPVVLYWIGRSWKKRRLDDVTADLYAVSIGQANDAWAVGSIGASFSTTDAFAAHWNGRRWRTVRAHVREDYDQFFDVAVVSPTEAWALQDKLERGAIIQRWNGRRWRIAWVSNRTISLNGVVASHGEAWAVGGRSGHPFLLHWNGKAWSPFASSLAHVQGDLAAVSALSRHRIWAVGTNLLARYSCS
jgi:hypothetical protein